MRFTSLTQVMESSSVTVVRSGKACCSGGESPPSSAAGAAGVQNESNEWKGLTNRPRPRVARRKEGTGGPMVLPGRTTVEKRTQGKARAASGTRIPLKQFSLESLQTQAGTESPCRNPTLTRPHTGEGEAGLPGSKSVARAEGDARNRGGPESPCRTNCEGQAGRGAQRQEAPLWPAGSRIGS